jgi:hypothetical protein
MMRIRIITLINGEDLSGEELSNENISSEICVNFCNNLSNPSHILNEISIKTLAKKS